MENTPTPDLLRRHAQIAAELRRRGVVRSANNPLGDYAEFLFCRALEWKQAPNSERSIDATAKDGVRYQIKARRLHRFNKSRLLSAMRNLRDGRFDFDFLAGALFDEEYRVLKAALVPQSVVMERARFSKHTNSYRFYLRDDIWDVSGVRDVTEELQAIA